MKGSASSARGRGIACAALHLTTAAALLCLSGAAAAHRLQSDAAPPDADHARSLPEQDTGAVGPARRRPFPVPIRGAFRLVDHNGVPRSDADFRDRYLLVFFGYVDCRSMCTVGLRRMAQAVDELGAAGERVQPIVITVDPENDTPEVLRRELAKIHPRLLGLTGSPEALEAAYRAYRLRPRLVGTDLAGNRIVSHTSYIYLMERDGTLATLLPPILSPQRMSAIIAGYLGGDIPQ